MSNVPSLSGLEKVSAQLKSLAHPTRIQILTLLGTPGIAPQRVTAIIEALGQKQATVSQHLIVLKDRGVLRSEKVGTSIYYELALPWCKQIAAILTKQADATADNPTA